MATHYPRILAAHRNAPDWATMSVEQENAHWQEVQRRYLKPLDLYTGEIDQSRENEILDVVRVNCPPLLMDRMSGGFT